jgi:hypothetical protein
MEFEESKVYKYVRLDTGELRFCPGGSAGSPSHKSLVKETDRVLSAGTIGVLPGDKLLMLDEGSMTLNLCAGLSSDRPLIEKETGRKFR